MRRWTVIVAPSVWGLIHEQVRYIARHSVDNALAWETRVDTAIFALAAAPLHTVDAEATRRIGRPIHTLVFERTYLIHYWLDDPAGTLNVIGFRHGVRLARDGEP